MEGEEGKTKGRVCVTGGTGFVASWLIMKLLQRGYSVNTTVRSSHLQAGTKKDLSFLTNLPHAQDKLEIFNADLENPESFKPAIQGCVGVFHLVHPVDFQEADSEEKSVRGTLGILQACLQSGTVKRVVHTSSAGTLIFKDRVPDGVALDEASWSDVDYMRKLNFPGSNFFISKMVTERSALDFAENHCLDLVIVIPTLILGPFLCPNLPDSVKIPLAMIIGNDTQVFKCWERTAYVHTDDVAEAHIHLFEHPEAKGRYICSALEAPVSQLFEIVSSRYPEFQLQADPESMINPTKLSTLSSKKLLETGFSYRYGLEEMYDGAIQSCKQKGFL